MMGEWGRWEDFGQLFVQSVRWLCRRVESEMLWPEITVHGDTTVITIDARARDRRFPTSVKVEGLLRTPQGLERQQSFDQTAFGRFEATVETRDSGPYAMAITARDSADRDLDTLHLGFFVPSGLEYRKIAADVALLSDLAAVSGGSLLDIEGSFDVESAAATYRPIGSPLVGAALVLFLLEIVLRRRAGLLPRQALDQRS
jgi:hypothetical protein